MLFALFLALAAPSQWAPARWTWTDPSSLELLNGSPVNCLLVEWAGSAEIGVFADRARERGIATLAVLRPRQGIVEEAQRAVRSRLAGVVLEGEFPDGTASRVRDAIAGSGAAVVELAPRGKMKLSGGGPILGTYEGVWAGIEVLDNGAAKGGPTGGPWIDTNSGFVRTVRAWGSAEVWLGNLPPEKTVVKTDRYLRVIADAGMAGAHWILALDRDLASRLQGREAAALRDWKRMMDLVAYFEAHREWRQLTQFGKLALVQEPGAASLLSGGILDMIAVKHTPVRPVPRSRLSAERLAGATLAVNVDGEGLTPEQRDVLRGYTRSGGTLLTGPPGWKGPETEGRITLGEKDIERLNDIWKEVNGMIGRRNLGARMFNVASVLSNMLTDPGGRQVVIQLVNYSDYPVESVAVHLLGKFSGARLITPEEGERKLEIYEHEEGSGVDIEKINVCATLVVSL